MTTLKIGDVAPAFTSKDQNGKDFVFEKKSKTKTILFFYPKDDTPGCTAEACSLRDAYDELKTEGFTLIGISVDDEKKHLKFIDKHKLPFNLIADTEKTVVNLYGVWAKKKFMGREYMGILRTTFVVGKNGIIEHIITDVDTKNAAQQILDLYK